MEKKYLNDSGVVKLWDKMKSHVKDTSDNLQKSIDSNKEKITANKSAQDAKNTFLDEGISKLNTRDDQITESLKNIAVTGGASVATAVTYDNKTSNLDAANVQGAVDELQTKKFDKNSIVQETGDAEDKVMSQKVVSNKLSDLYRKAYIIAGGNIKPITIKKELIDKVEHIKVSIVTDENVDIRYDNKRFAVDTSTKELDYANPLQKKELFVAINVETKQLVMKEYNNMLDNNEYYLFSLHSLFGANLPLDWVNYEGFDNNILSNKVDGLYRKAYIIAGGNIKPITIKKELIDKVEHIKVSIVTDENVDIRYDNKRFAVDTSTKELDYANPLQKKELFVAINVETKQLVMKEYNNMLDNNEYYLFSLHSLFGANLPLDWVNYEGFDNNILSNKVDGLEEAIGKFDSIFMFNPNYIYEPKIATLKKKTPYGYSPKNSPLVLLWFSDLHGNINNLKRIIEWKDKYSSYIDDILNTGDTITDNISSYNTDYINYLSNGGTKVLKAIGNHDVCASDFSAYKGWSGVPSETVKTIYDKYISKIEDSTIVKPDNVETGKSYYYKDYVGLGKSDSAIRLIILDSVINKSAIISSGSGASTVSTETYQKEQSDWLSNVLNDAKEKGYAVICAHHFNAKTTEFNNETGFINRTNKLNPNADCCTPEDWLDKIDTFINNGGDFICWLCGHVHQDYLGIIDGHNNQIQISIITASTRLDSAESGEPARQTCTKTQDAFDIIAFDTYYKYIRLVRVGCDFDNFGHKLDMLCIDYKNKTIL